MLETFTYELEISEKDSEIRVTDYWAREGIHGEQVFFDIYIDDE